MSPTGAHEQTFDYVFNGGDNEFTNSPAPDLYVIIRHSVELKVSICTIVTRL